MECCWVGTGQAPWMATGPQTSNICGSLGKSCQLDKGTLWTIPGTSNHRVQQDQSRSPGRRRPRGVLLRPCQPFWPRGDSWFPSSLNFREEAIRQWMLDTTVWWLQIKNGKWSRYRTPKLEEEEISSIFQARIPLHVQHRRIWGPHIRDQDGFGKEGGEPCGNWWFTTGCSIDKGSVWMQRCLFRAISIESLEFDRRLQGLQYQDCSKKAKFGSRLLGNGC